MRRDGKNFEFIVVMRHPPSLQHCRLVFIGLFSSFIAAFSETFILRYKLPTNQQFSPVSAFTLSIHNTIFETEYIWTINGINSLIRVIYTGNNISQFMVSSSIKSDGRWCSDHYLLRLDTVLWEIIERCKKVANHHELDQVVMLLKLQH